MAVPADARGLPLGKLYFLTIATIGTLAAVFAFVHFGHIWPLTRLAGHGRPLAGTSELGSVAFWVFVALGVATELVTAPLPNGGRLTAGFAVLFASLILLGPPCTLTVLALTSVVGSLFQGRSWLLSWFNFGQYAIAYLSAYGILRAGHLDASDLHGHWPLLLVASAAYLLLNVLQVNGYIALEKKIPLDRVFWEDDRWELLFTLVQAPVSILLVVSYQSHGWAGAALVLIPLLASTALLVLLLRVRQARSRLDASLADLAAANVRLDEANRELRLLQDVAQKIVSQIDLPKTLGLIARETGTVVASDEVLIYLADPDTGNLGLQRAASGRVPGRSESAGKVQPPARGTGARSAFEPSELAPYEPYIVQAAASQRPIRLADLCAPASALLVSEPPDAPLDTLQAGPADASSARDSLPGYPAGSVLETSPGPQTIGDSRLGPTKPLPKVSPAHEFRSILAVPIPGDDRAAGAIAVLARDPGQFSERDQALLVTLASHATFAIRNAQLYQATQMLAITDGLTGVYNRRYFQRQLENELRRAPRYGFPTSLIMLDVDHFKAFNDSNGHLLGDHVLRSVAQILKESVRETDVVARYGGEEFAVILPETSKEVALTVGERIRSRIHAHLFAGKGQKPARLTASLGIATHTTSETTADHLIDRADKALYTAKHAGRDRICAWVQFDAEPQDHTSHASPALPRQPARVKVAIDITAWQHYLNGRLEALAQALVERVEVASGTAPADGSLVSPDDRDRWRALISQGLASLGEQLAHPGDEALLAAPSVDDVMRLPFYSAVRSEISRWISHGLTMTSSENLVLGLCNSLGEHVRHAPFSPQEQLVVLAAVERFSHTLQLAVSSIWHEYYQQTNTHLVVIQQLDDRLHGAHELDDLLAEAVAQAGEALQCDVSVLLLADDAARAGGPGELRIRSSWGLTSDEVRGWVMPTDQGLSGQAFTTRQPQTAIDVLRDSRVYRPIFEPIAERTGVISGLCVPLLHQGAAIGVLELFSRDRRSFTQAEVRLARSIAGHIGAAIERARLEEVRQDRYLAALSTLIEAIEARDAFALGHHESLVDLVDRLGSQLGLEPSQSQALSQAGRFHDVGKIAVPDDVLLKPGRLDSAEREAIEVHPEMGARLLAPVASLSEAIAAIRHHHERWNGTGYPAGLAGEQIPLLARILAVAEAWEGMTTAKAYRAAIEPRQALGEMRASGHFDPGILDALEAVVVGQAPDGEGLAGPGYEASRSTPPA